LPQSPLPFCSLTAATTPRAAADGEFRLLRRIGWIGWSQGGGVVPLTIKRRIPE
jgi:hypothetical protein